MPQYLRNLSYFVFLILLYVYSRSEGGRYPTFLFVAIALLFCASYLFFWHGKKSTKINLLLDTFLFEAYTSIDFQLEIQSSTLTSGTLSGYIRIPRLWGDSESLPFRDHGLHPQTQSLPFHLQVGRRGKYLLGPVYMQISDPLGLFHKELCLHQGIEIWITPSFFLATTPLMLNNEQDSSQEYFSLSGRPSSSSRPYQQGDSWQRIHWKATAHSQKIMVRENETEEDQPTLLWLDLSRHSYYRNPETLEKAISLAASLLKEYSQHGQALRFISTGWDHWEAHLPTSHFDEILKHLAVAAADGEAPAQATMPALPKKNKLLMITSRLTPSLADELNRLLWENQSITIFLTSGTDRKHENFALNPMIEVRWVVSV